MGRLQGLKDQLDSLGFELIAIAPDSTEKLIGVRDRVELTFRQLSDVDFVASKAFGIAFLHNGKRPRPVPSIFVVAPDRTIQFQYINPDYKVRVEEGVLLEMAKAVAKAYK